MNCPSFANSVSCICKNENIDKFEREIKYIIRKIEDIIIRKDHVGRHSYSKDEVKHVMSASIQPNIVVR